MASKRNFSQGKCAMLSNLFLFFASFFPCCHSGSVSAARRHDALWEPDSGGEKYNSLLWRSSTLCLILNVLQNIYMKGFKILTRNFRWQASIEFVRAGVRVEREPLCTGTTAHLAEQRCAVQKRVILVLLLPLGSRGPTCSLSTTAELASRRI